MVSPAEWSWVDLPPVVTASIFSRLTASDILTRAQFVCKAWLEASKDPLVWKRIVIGEFEDEICRRAIDRSCGQAVEVYIRDVADDELLDYICDRSSRIKRLRLLQCDAVSDKVLIRSVEKLTLLEDLDLSLCFIEPEILGAVGQKCPRLKAFKKNRIPIWQNVQADDVYRCNEEVLAIGKNMPGLKSLQLMGNFMTDKGLEAILDGCPRLESLDIRNCRNLSLEGKIWKRYLERVKRLRLPRESYFDSQPPTYLEFNYIDEFLENIDNGALYYDDDDDGTYYTY